MSRRACSAGENTLLNISRIASERNRMPVIHRCVASSLGFSLQLTSHRPIRLYSWLECGSLTPLRSSARAASSNVRPSTNYYEMLGLIPSTEVTREEIKSAYRQQALRFHPDCHPRVEGEGEDGEAPVMSKAEAEVQFRRVAEAYATLSNISLRQAYDKQLGLQPPGAAASSSFPNPSVSRPAGSVAGRGLGSRLKTRSTRRPFLRGDANRVFKEVFSGKSLEDVLFEARRRSRRGAATGGVPRSGSSEEAQLSGLYASLNVVAESHARRLRAHYGVGAAAKARVGFTVHRSNPTPPGAQLPFFPFQNMRLPDGVVVPATPRLGPWTRVEELGDDAKAFLAETAEGEISNESAVAAKGEQGIEVTRQSSRERRLSKRTGSLDKARQALRLQYSGVQGEGSTAHTIPYNMGQLYSYHRPF